VRATVRFLFKSCSAVTAANLHHFTYDLAFPIDFLQRWLNCYGSRLYLHTFPFLLLTYLSSTIWTNATGPGPTPAQTRLTERTIEIGDSFSPRYRLSALGAELGSTTKPPRLSVFNLKATIRTRDAFAQLAQVDPTL
jgi:hypothetical protein